MLWHGLSILLKHQQADITQESLQIPSDASKNIIVMKEPNLRMIKVHCGCYTYPMNSLINPPREREKFKSKDGLGKRKRNSSMAIGNN